MTFAQIALMLWLAFAPPPLHFKGKVLNVGETRIALETSDGSVLTLLVNSRSRILEKTHSMVIAQLREGDNLDVDVQQDAKGSFIVIEARLVVRTDVDEEAGPPKLKRRAAGDTSDRAAPRAVAKTDDPVLNTAPRTVTDEGVPSGLKDPDRGGFSDSERAVMNGTGRRSSNPKMELIDRASDAAVNFVERLPNYVCQQFTTRYQSTTNKVDWRAVDVVSASVVYENGKEDYKNIAVNGRVVNKKMEEIGGSTSTGEFGTILLNLFHPRTAADFQFIKESVSSRVTTGVYDYSVKQANSNWEIHSEGVKAIQPAYRGRVWIDTSKGRVIRIEMEATNMPEDFPIDKVETAIDYDYVSLGTERYLLPVKSESISCQRGSAYCSKNVIEWRNYHKYTGESTITFGTPQ